MLVFELINNELMPLRQQDSVGHAVSVMEDKSMYYYPVVDGSSGQFVGEVSLDELKVIGDSDAHKVDESHLDEHVLRESDHILEASRKMLLLNRAFLPVVDRNGNYLGTVTKNNLIDSVIRLLNLRETGTIIMIEMNARDYMLSDVIRIIEAEGARILAMTIQAPDSVDDHVRISVKLNLDDLARVGSALRRYGYLISSESRSELTGNELSEKADEFFRYLDI